MRFLSAIVAIVAVYILFLLSGCASVGRSLSKSETALSNFLSVEEFEDNDMSFEDIMMSAGMSSPPSYPGTTYKWVPPVVQEVQQPAMVRNGVYIPAHKEYAIVDSGAYVYNDTFYSETRQRYRIPENVQIVSPTKTADVVLAIFKGKRIFSKPTIMPIKKAAFLLQSLPMRMVLALGDEEVTKIGSSLCIVFKGDDNYTIKTVRKEKEISSYSLDSTHALFFPDGYIVVPIFERSTG